MCLVFIHVVSAEIYAPVIHLAVDLLMTLPVSLAYLCILVQATEKHSANVDSRYTA
jgi:hypothetical protein